MEFKELMALFGEQCGVGALEVDENGVAAIQADETRLSFMELPTTRQLVLFAEIAALPEAGREKLYEALLMAQYVGAALDGATFALSPDGELMLQRFDALVDLDLAKFATVVESFLNQVDKWREIVTAYRPDEAPAETKAAEEEMPQNLGLGGNPGFLSV